MPKVSRSGLAIVSAVVCAGSIAPARAAGLTTVFALPATANGTAAKGTEPIAGVTLGPSGVLYGSTIRGGNTSSNGYGGGVVYKLTPPKSGSGAWTESVLHAFTGGVDGIFPGRGNLLLSSGNLFGVTNGTASFGGCKHNTLSCDTVYELSPPAAGQTAWTYNLLYRFTTDAEGYYPQGGLIADASGALYGTTAAGGNTGCTSSYTNGEGTQGCGTIFKLTPPAAGGTAWTRTALHVFSGGADGGIPLAALTAAPGGVFYGTASTGGGGTCSFNAQNCGVVFKLTPPPAGKTVWTETVLYSFTGQGDGLAPEGALVLRGGVLYGTAMSGGSSCSIYGCGTVFQLSPPSGGGTKWSFKTLYAFKGGADGGVPMAGVAFGASGALYGTTFQYGDTKVDCGRFVGCGTVFKLTPPPSGKSAWTEAPLYTFTGGATGGQSNASLTLDAGVFFGTAALGGSAQCPPSADSTCGGTVFRVTP